VLSFLFCITGGLLLLSRCSFTDKNDTLSLAIGLYFVGKAFFVGPMLFVVSGKCGQCA